MKITIFSKTKLMNRVDDIDLYFCMPALIEDSCVLISVSAFHPWYYVGLKYRKTIQPHRYK